MLPRKLVDYLRDCFDGDIEAFVPHMAMSAGTMIACACKKIYMGRQSSINPPTRNSMVYQLVAFWKNSHRR